MLFTHTLPIGSIFYAIVALVMTSAFSEPAFSEPVFSHPSSAPLQEAPLTTSLLASGASAKNLSDMNIVLIFDDSLRADHLGCYGYVRDTSPYIDALAAQATVFENAMSVSSYTCESVSAVFSGLLPSMSGVSAGWFATPSDTRENLAGLFSKAGYVTGYFTNWAALFDPAFGKGFTETDHITLQYGVSGNGAELSDRALTFTARHAQRKTLICMHYADPHYPYDPSDELYLRFDDQVYPAPLPMNEVLRNLPSLLTSGFGPGEQRFDDFMLRYDAEIAGIDDAIRRLVEGLDALGTLDRTVIILTADHGQEFLEHGFVAHACQLYRESVNVPLIFWAPGVFPAQRIPDCVSLVDILPTLIELAEIPSSRTDFFGAPLFQRSGDSVSFASRIKPVIAETLLETRSLIRTVIHQGYKYHAAQRWFTPAELSHLHEVHAQEVEALRNGQYPLVNPWGPVVHEELYNLGDDPDEQNSVLNDHPDKTAEFRNILDQYRTLCLNLPQETIAASERPRPPNPDLPVPRLNSIAPAAGPSTGGTRVTLRGTNLVGAWILFDGISGTQTTVNPDGSEVRTTTPPHAAGAVRVTALTPLGTTYPLAFVYELPPPKADFSVTPTEGDVPLTVQFQDTSVAYSLESLEWRWDFGDGQLSFEQNPAHTYTESGAYTVTLTVTTGSGTHSRSREWCIDVGHVLPATTGQESTLTALLLAVLGTGLIRRRRFRRRPLAH